MIAFNGLMETAYAWPGYLDERRWKRLCRAGFAGPTKDNSELPSSDGSEILPRRPSWAQKNEIVYRECLFGRFHGFLTYGSPLAKFAARTQRISAMPRAGSCSLRTSTISLGARVMWTPRRIGY